MAGCGLGLLLLPLLLATAVEASSGAHCTPRHRERHGRTHFFDLLMANPHGKIVEPPVAQCPDQSTLPTGRPALPNGPVSQWVCPDGREEGNVCAGVCRFRGDPYTATCTRDGAWQITAAQSPCTTCFSGDSKVVVKGRRDPVAIRDVRVGESIMCFEGGTDLSTPGVPRWCTVRSFSRAEETSFTDMVRITVKGGFVTTVSWMHLMHHVTNLTHEGPAGSPEQLGPYEVDVAINLKPGQLMPVASSLDLSATFTAAVIESVEPVTAMGKYLPSIESPYILVDGLAVPLRASWFKVDCVAENRSLKFTSPILPRDQIAVKHYFTAPTWMATKQPVGTPGLHAQWAGAPRSPFTSELGKVIEEMSGVASLNFTRARAWFMPKYEAWLRDPSNVITEAQALEAFPLMFDPIVNPGNASCTAHRSAAHPTAKPMAFLVDRWGKTRELLGGAHASTCSLV